MPQADHASVADSVSRLVRASVEAARPDAPESYRLLMRRDAEDATVALSRAIEDLESGIVARIKSPQRGQTVNVYLGPDGLSFVPKNPTNTDRTALHSEQAARLNRQSGAGDSGGQDGSCGRAAASCGDGIGASPLTTESQSGAAERSSNSPRGVNS